MVTPFLILALTGCGRLTEVREARQTERADPVATTTQATGTVSAPLRVETTATAPAAPQSVPTQPGPATSPAIATPSLAPPTATAAAISAQDTAGDELMLLLDQWGSELDAEDGGVEAEIP
jgi:hypothetical protein